MTEIAHCPDITQARQRSTAPGSTAAAALIAEWNAVYEESNRLQKTVDQAPGDQKKTLNERLGKTWERLCEIEDRIAGTQGAGSSLTILKLKIALMRERVMREPDDIGPLWRMVQSALGDLEATIPAAIPS